MKCHVCGREAKVRCWVCNKPICNKHWFYGNSCGIDEELSLLDENGKPWLVRQPKHKKAEEKYRRKGK